MPPYPGDEGLRTTSVLVQAAAVPSLKFHPRQLPQAALTPKVHWQLPDLQACPGPHETQLLPVPQELLLLSQTHWRLVQVFPVPHSLAVQQAVLAMQVPLQSFGVVPEQEHALLVHVLPPVHSLEEQQAELA